MLYDDCLNRIDAEKMKMKLEKEEKLEKKIQKKREEEDPVTLDDALQPFPTPSSQAVPSVLAPQPPDQSSNLKI